MPRRLRPTLSFTQGYARHIPDDISRTVPSSCFDPHLLVLQLNAEETRYRYLDLACVRDVAQRRREALLSHSKGLPHTVRSILSGHDSNGSPLDAPHLAFLPLAFVGQEHAEGHLLGTGLALPARLSCDDRQAVLDAVR